jgi:hypothetical protein
MRAELPGIVPWRHDLSHCLQSVAGMLLRYHGADPVEVLGSAWGFHYRARDARREEYYFPCWNGSLLASMAPYHGIRSRWHLPADPVQAWQEVRTAVAGGQPVAVAVDNYHLPFRPAYHDVHTNHLLVVHGFDDERETAVVADAIPPWFQGDIGLPDLTRARGSANPARHERDMFFTANPIRNRWLEVNVTGTSVAPDLDRVRGIIAANLAGYEGTGDGGANYSGLPGQQRFLADVAARLGDGDFSAVDEGFVVAGVSLAVTGMHGDFLAAMARRFRVAALGLVAREVDRLAHHWSAVRIIIAAGRDDIAAAAVSLARRAGVLHADSARVMEQMRRLTAEP